MQRVLDIDLDFFVEPPAHFVPRDGDRLPEADFNCWTTAAAIAFLREKCQLSDRLPGWVIEHHDEAFACWREAIASQMLVPPFHVTHLDAHADLGLGDAGYVHLLTDVMHRPVNERSAAEVVEHGLGFGNWLAFATACRWLSGIDYVFGPGGGEDLFPLYMTEERDGLQLRAATHAAIDDALRPEAGPLVGVADPVVPLRSVAAADFVAEDTYDAIVLCRSPAYTPASADEIFRV